MQAGIVVQPQTIVHRPFVPPGMQYEAEIEINDFPQHARWRVSYPHIVLINSVTTLKSATRLLKIFQLLLLSLYLDDLP